MAEFSRSAAAAFSASYGHPVARTRIDGGALLLTAIEIDRAEHARRLGAGVGAIDSLALLHGLWLIPAGGRVDVDSLPDVKRRALLDEVGSHVRVVDGAHLERTYAPAGVVRAVGFSGGNPERAIRSAARFTPIVERVVLLAAGATVPRRVLHEAREWGVGLLDLERGEFLVPALEAVRGVPAVYRWWIAELAYAQLVQDNAQPVS